MLVEEFSAGYYLTPLAVEPADTDTPRINDHDHEELLTEVYEDRERPVFKLGDAYVSPEPDAGTPANVLELPEDLLAFVGIDHPPARCDALVLKPWVIRYFTLTGDLPAPN